MKKCVMLVAVAVLVAFAAPAFAVTNPFMDVPMNHWAYDAIGQLAARGVLSGYPDGTYKGKQPTTRYEMASALARALAVVDMTKASKQDVEMLKKLVVEFKDELDALGVKVDQIDKRVAVLESRLGGWKISGVMRLDFVDRETNKEDGYTQLQRARLIFNRWFGEDESMKFTGRFNINGQNTKWELFNVEVPTWWDTKLTVGRFIFDMEADYYLNGTTAFLPVPFIGNDSWLTDRYTDGLALTKNFGMGSFTAYVTRPNGHSSSAGDNHSLSAWELFAMGKFQFTEQFAFDLGVQAFLGDDASTFKMDGVNMQLDSMWTVFAGLRFNFNDNIALKGMYYYQDASLQAEVTTGGWVDFDPDATSAYRIILDVKQDLLKFTSLWLEYNRLEDGFIMPTGTGILWVGDDGRAGRDSDFGNAVYYDTTIYRIGAMQKWNDKWTTALYYAKHNWDAAGDPSANQWVVGVTYQYNPNVAFGLAYSQYDMDSAAERTFGAQDDHVIRFRTQISF